MVELNQAAPDFSLPGDDGKTFRLADHRGERVLIVFYPGDNTPVCTRQLCEYRDGIEVFSGLGVRIVGISGDSVESHRKFREKHDFPFVLLSDEDLEVASAWGCKGALGMKRAVFLVDEAGTVRYAHIETLALFRRRVEELAEVIRNLDEGSRSEGAR
jgi:peroxiredoxin